MKRCDRTFLSTCFLMAEVVLTNSAPIFSYFEIFIGNSCDEFQLFPPCTSLVEIMQLSHRHRDCKQERKKEKSETSVNVLSHQRAWFDFHQNLRDDRGGPCHRFIPKFFRVQLIVQRLGAIENLSENQVKLLIVMLFIELKQPKLSDLSKSAH